MTDEILRKIYDATPPDEELEDIADFFKVFGDNTRLKIMIALLQSELCVQDIADVLQMTQSAISYSGFGGAPTPTFTRGNASVPSFILLQTTTFRRSCPWVSTILKSKKDI